MTIASPRPAAVASSLLEVSELMAGQTNRDEILERLAATACLVLNDCSSASVTLIDRGRAIIAGTTDDVAAVLDRAQYDSGSGPALRALREGKTVFVDFSGPSWPWVAAMARPRGVTTALSVPLTVGDLTLGALNLYSAVPNGLAGDADQVAAGLLADQAAVALAAAQALTVEHHTALALQRALLPSALPEISGYDIAAWYHPASSTAEVGGDWYDAFRVGDDGPLVLAIGDAVGHGIDAAALMGRLRTGLRAYAVEGHDPATCLSRLSHLVEATRSPADVAFATVSMVLIDTVTGMARVASAGHLPLALRAEPGQISFISGLGGPPVGVSDEPIEDEHYFALNPGAALVLFTDGLIEDRRRSIEEGLDQLADVLAAPIASATDLGERLIDDLLGDRLQEDDVAVLVLVRSEKT